MSSSNNMSGVLIQILNELKEIKSDYKEFKASQDKQALEFQAVFEELRKENLTLKTTVKDLFIKNSLLETKVFALEFGLNNILQEKLANNLIISGIPVLEEEDLPKLLRKICLKLDVKIDNSKYKIRRLFTKKCNRYTNLLVEFEDINIKTALLKQQKVLALSENQLGFNSNKPILFFHQLTSTFLNILNEARKLKDLHNFAYVWYQNNQVLIKRQNENKIYSIKCLKDLTDLVNSSKDLKEGIADNILNCRRTTRKNGQRRK